MTKQLQDIFHPPFTVQAVYPQGVEQPPIFVVRDEAMGAVCGVQVEDVADMIAGALNEHADFVRAIKADDKLATRFVTTLARENRSAKGDV